MCYTKDKKMANSNVEYSPNQNKPTENMGGGLINGMRRNWRFVKNAFKGILPQSSKQKNEKIRAATQNVKKLTSETEMQRVLQKKRMFSNGM